MIYFGATNSYRILSSIVHYCPHENNVKILSTRYSRKDSLGIGYSRNFSPKSIANIGCALYLYVFKRFHSMCWLSLYLHSKWLFNLRS